MKLYLFLLIGLAFFVPGICQAQSLSPEVLGTASGRAQLAGITLDWTLGETAIGRWSVPGGFVTEGFHQPFLEVTLLPEYTSPQVRIAPNPVQSTLNVQLQVEYKHGLFASLVDVQGRVLIRRTTLQLGNTELDLSNLPAGMYFLNVSPQHGNPIEVFKVVKIF